MTTRSQVLLVLAVMCGALLMAKTLVDMSRVRPRIEDEARVQSRFALAQTGPLVERAYRDGHLDDARQGLSRLAAIPGAQPAALVDDRGVIRAASDTTLEGRQASEIGLAWAADVAQQPSAAPASVIDGNALLVATPVRLESATSDSSLSGRATLALEIDLADRLEAARRPVLVENGIATCVVLVVLLLLAVLLRTQLTEPARRVAEAIEQFDSGERGARSGLKGQTEIARIAKAFDRMAEQVQAEENELLDIQVRLERVLKAMPMGVMVVRRSDGHPFYVNPRWRELFGIPMDASRDILGLLSTVRCERPDGSPYPIEQLPIPTVLRTGEPSQTCDLRVRRDDSVVTLVASAFPVCLSGADSFDAVLALASDAREPTAARTGLPTAAGPQRPEPRALASPDPAAAGAAPRQTDAARPGEGPDRETVLVAEGDPETLGIARRALDRAGYRVLAASDGHQAMILFAREGPRLRALVLDLALAGPSGEMLLDEVLALDPTIKIIAASGYREDLPVLAASGKISAFLTRPYSAERLVASVREAVKTAPGVERLAGA